MTMNETAVEGRVMSILNGVLQFEKPEFDSSKALAESNTIDSLSLLKLMVSLEAEFKIAFDENTLEETFYSVDSIIAAVKAKVGAPADAALSK